MNRRIWQERVRLGISRKQASEILGVTIARLKGLETRDTPPKLEDIGALAKLFGMDSQYILIGQRFVATDEAALLDNYRSLSPDNKTVLGKTIDSIKKQVDDDVEKCA